MFKGKLPPSTSMRVISHWVKGGFTSKQIADKHKISETTVNRIITKYLKK